MTVLHLLTGKPTKDCTREELENWILRHRLGREVAAEGAAPKKRAAGTGKKKIEIPDFDLLDDEELDLDL